jgi:hypothetical protein
MDSAIKDEFSDLPISRQRKYQLRRKRDRRCTECGAPAAEGSRCIMHLVKARERQRRKRGLKRRRYNTLSYRLAGENDPKTPAALRDPKPTSTAPATESTVESEPTDGATGSPPS